MNDILEKLPGTPDAWAWWEARRLRYNLGLAVAGWTAYAAFWLVMLGFGEAQHVDLQIMLTATLMLGGGFLVVMAAANLCYLAGVGLETLLRPRDPAAFRERFWALGFWGSCALPLLLPLFTLAVTLGQANGFD